MLEKTIKYTIVGGWKLIKIPTIIGGKIIYKVIKVPAEFAWTIMKIPLHLGADFARHLSKMVKKHLDPKEIEVKMNEIINKDKRKKKSKLRRFKNGMKAYLHRLVQK